MYELLTTREKGAILFGFASVPTKCETCDKLEECFAEYLNDRTGEGTQRYKCYQSEVNEILEICRTAHKVPKAKKRNPRTQFEMHIAFSDSSQKSKIKEAYEWCIDNLPLKDEHGIIYQVDELYIITASQPILDKINARFGTKFAFNDWDNRVQFI